MKKDFSADLSEAFDALKARGNITMGDIIDIHGASALGAILTVISIPALLPSTGIPIGTVMSLGMFAVALSMMMGVEHVKLPKKLSGMALSDNVAEKFMSKLLSFYRFLERWSDPRLQFLVDLRARQFLSILVFLLAAIIFMPIPFGNTAPAFALLILGPALLLRDGLLVLVSFVLLLRRFWWRVLQVLCVYFIVWVGGVCTVFSLLWCLS